MPPILLSVLLNKYTYIIGAVLAIVLYIGILRHEVSTLREDNAKLQVAVEEQKKAIQELQQDHASIIKAKDELVAENEKLQKDREALQKKLDTKIPLGAMAEKHAKLIENAVNNGTQKVLKCFETISEGGKC